LNAYLYKVKYIQKKILVLFYDADVLIRVLVTFSEAVPGVHDEEPLYDQVPMDAEGDYVYLATTTTAEAGHSTGQEKASNESGGSMGSISDLDGETTMKSQASGYSACSSETGTTDTEPGPAPPTPPPESPKRSNYVNIDYFIK
jgi:hypothetical protein